MNQYLSDKIRNLSFIAILAVFIIHTDTFAERGSTAYRIQQFVHTAANFAVPFFFIISGYLFFHGKDKFDEIKRGIKRRGRTLLIPYLLWCTLFVIQLWIASRFTTLSQDYFEILRNGEILRFIKRMFIAPLLAFHLWYVRDLIALVIISPLIWVCQRRHPLIFLLTICITCGFLRLLPWLSWGLTWFSIGSYFALANKELLNLKRKWVGLLLLSFYLITTWILLSESFYITPDRWYTFPLILIGIFGIWNSYDLLGISNHIPRALTGQTFFLYCAHVPFLSMVAIIVFPIIAVNPVISIFGYFIPAIITCAVLICISLLWQRLNRHSSISRRIYQTLTGGR